MRITFDKTELVRGNSYCEEAKDLKIKGSKEIQISTPLRANFVSVFDRGNLKTVVTFNTTRKHNDKNESELYALKHAANVSTKHGSVLFDLEDCDKTLFCLSNASIKHIESTSYGVLSTHAYEIIGSKFENIK